MSRDSVGDLVTAARAKTEAERALSQVRLDLAEIEYRLEAIAAALTLAREVPRRGWFRRRAVPTENVELREEYVHRRTELEIRREALRREANELAKRASGAQLARAQLGRELGELEESLRASGADVVAELDGLELLRRPLREELRRETEVAERLRTVVQMMDDEEYYLLLLGWGQAVSTREQLEVLSLLLGGDPRGDRIRDLMVAEIDSLRRWFALIREVVGALRDEVEMTSEQIRAELVRIDKRRIDLLTSG